MEHGNLQWCLIIKGPWHGGLNAPGATHFTILNVFRLVGETGDLPRMGFFMLRDAPFCKRGEHTSLS